MGEGMGSARRLSIVAHNGSAGLGGGEISVARLLVALERRGHRVRMLCRDSEIAGRLRELTGVPTSTLRIGGSLMLPDALRFARALRRYQPDAVLLTTFKKVFLAGLGARLSGVPRVVQRIGLSGDAPRSATQRYALRNFLDLVILNADSLREDFLRADPQLPGSRVVTVYDGVETPRRVRPTGALRAELGIPAAARVIGAVSRLAWQKRFDRLLHAASKLPDDVHVLLAGEGEEREKLGELAGELGIASRVHLPGFFAEIGDVLDVLDLFVITSEREGMANAMLEAMAFGVPCLSTDVSGAREALGPRQGEPPVGVVTGHDLDEITEALHRLLSDPTERRRLGHVARARFLECFSLDRMVLDWEGLLTPSPGGRSPGWSSRGPKATAVHGEAKRGMKHYSRSGI